MDDSDNTLTLDFMLSLKLYIEDEYILLPVSNNSDYIILKIIDYLRELSIPIEQIKEAMYSLYNNVDPSKKEIIDNILYPQGLSQLFASIVNQYSDPFTGDIVNPANILDMFTENLNNLPNNFQITVHTNGIDFSNVFNNNFNIFSLMQLPQTNKRNYTHISNEDILEEYTQLITFKNLDETLRTKYNTCFICLADFDQEDTVRKIKCDHIFHKNCIDPWLLKESYKCPACRANIVEDYP